MPNSSTTTVDTMADKPQATGGTLSITILAIAAFVIVTTEFLIVGLLPALARLIIKASRDSQVVVVSHSTRLVAALEREGGAITMTLEKEYGETLVPGQHTLERPAWRWPKR